MRAKRLPLSYERSARSDLTAWYMLLVGAGSLFAAFTVDPLENCNSVGECAPWLVPIAGIMGACATAMALGRLLANPRRGYGIDPETGNLFWWKGRTAKHEGDTGSVHTAQIVSIRVDLRRLSGVEPVWRGRRTSGLF